ncbi:P21-activated kinase [Aphelenchoides avenae]|nr:P21-activated kinase [Aphelenchus avenae]
MFAYYSNEPSTRSCRLNGVFRAQRKEDPKQAWSCAIKRIKVDSLDKSRERANYAKALTEAKLMLKFGQHAHQHLMPAKAVYSDGEYVSIVMDIVRPGSLSSVITAVSNRKLGFVEVAVAAVIKGATKGLVFLHSQGIMHRDMKSDNVLLNEKGIVKLTDFGQTATNGPARFTRVGTRLFAAPELNQCLGSTAPHTNAIDVWPLPLIAMECLTQAELPEFDFIDDNFRAEVHDWCNGKIAAKDLPQPTQAFQDFVNVCLVKNPSERFTARALLALPFLKTADESAVQSLVQQILS